MNNKVLNVFSDQTRVGKLIQNRSGLLTFRYVPEYLNTPNARAISQSLPLQENEYEGKACRAFFAGLLPDGDKRDLVAALFHISSKNDFAILDKIGGDCAGCLSLLPEGEPPTDPQNFEYKKLTSPELANILRTLPKRPLMSGSQDIRISLAGAQDKVALLQQDDAFFLPLHGAPSSHIIKPAHSEFDDLVVNEAFCLHLARSCGLPTIDASINTVEDEQYLVLKRYDRFYRSGKWHRLHQEDFCQALGIAPELKYQNEGGPSIRDGINLIRKCSSVPVMDIKMFLEAILFNFMIGNHDAHAKNFSLLYREDSVSLAPLYDLICTAVYEAISKKMAMKIGNQYESLKINKRSWQKFSEDVDVSFATLSDMMQSFAQKLISVLSQPNKPDIFQKSEIVQKIESYCLMQAKGILAVIE